MIIFGVFSDDEDALRVKKESKENKDKKNEAKAAAVAKAKLKSEAMRNL